VKAKKERAKPVPYSQELADKICDRLAAGETLRAVCESDGMPSEMTVRRWALDADSPFSSQYARAREVGYHRMADELLDIADDAGLDANDKRIRVDTRKWQLSKALPKIDGDKLDLKATITQTHEQELDLLDRIAAEREAGNGQAIEGVCKSSK